MELPVKFGIWKIAKTEKQALSNLPYISKTLCEDLTETVKTKLGIKKGAKPATPAAAPAAKK